MALIDSWSDFWSRFARNALDRVGFPFTEAYLRAWCKVVQKYPNLVGIPFYGRAFVKATCPLNGFPDPPGKGVPNYPDLRCYGVKYWVRISVARQFNGEASPITLPELAVWGRITDVGIRQDPNIATSFLQAYVSGQNQNGQPYTVTASIGGVGVSAQYIGYTARRDDGVNLYASCPIEYPDYDPDPPVDPKDFNPIIKLPVYVNNVITGYNYIPVKINLNPSLSLGVDFDIGGDKYYFDFSGWNIGDPGNADGGGDRLPPGGGGGDSGGGDSGGGDENTGTEFDPDLLDEEELLEEEIEKPGIKWAKVVVSQLPTSGKRLVSANSDNVDHFSGFFSWTIANSGTFRMEEIPIRKRRYIFRAPKGATGVKYYAINGAILSVSVFTTKET